MSLVDYVPYTSSVIFTFGCQFRCSHCHNPEMIIDSIDSMPLNPNSILMHLESNKKWIDGVVITGGEPTLQSDLPEFIKKIKQKRFLVKLDTNGTNPDVLRKLIDRRLVDYFAMDVKTNFESYPDLVGASVDINKLKKSIQLISESKVDYEFRTTVVPGLVGEKELLGLAKYLEGHKKYVLQNFSNRQKMINEKMKEIMPYSHHELIAFQNLVRPYFQEVQIRE